MIVIIDYGIGNLASVLNMFKKIGSKDVVISNNKDTIANATKLLLPGVGAFDAGMNNLNASGLVPLLNEKVISKKNTYSRYLPGHAVAYKKKRRRQRGWPWLDRCRN